MSNEDLFKIIPDSIRDESTEGYEACIAAMMNLDLSPCIPKLIDSCPASMLPYLAEEFSINEDEGWALATNDAQKRALIKKSIPIHRKKGYTIGIKEIFSQLDLEGDIKKWHEYGGKAGHIKVVADLINRSLNDQTEEQLRRMIAGSKRQSAILDNLQLNLATTGENHVACFSQQSETIETFSKET